MTQNQLKAQGIKFPWTLNEKTKTFSTELSDLEANGMYQSGHREDTGKPWAEVTGPTGKVVPFSIFEAQYDQERELTEWSVYGGEYFYIIFND